MYREQGYSSLFIYCTKHLRLSEHAANGRIEAARAASKVRVILDRLADGSITLTTVSLLSNHLTGKNHEQLLDNARHKTRREIEELVAALHSMPVMPASIRKLPQPTVIGLSLRETVTVASMSVASEPLTSRCVNPENVSPAVPAIVRPLAPERFKVQFSIGRETHEKLRRLQDLLRHSLPNGDIAEIFDRALTSLLKEVERRKIGKVNQPRNPGVLDPGQRHVPAPVRRKVWARDEGRCAFIGTHGRCEERGFLESPRDPVR